MSQSQSEMQVAEVIKKVCGSVIKDSLQSALKTLRIKLISDSDGSNIMVITLPLPLLDAIQQYFSEIQNKLQKQFSEFQIFFIREAVYNPNNTLNKKLQENWLKDLCFPSVVNQRMTVVKEGGNIKEEKVFVERKSEFTEEEFYSMKLVFKELTGRDVEYGLRYY
ncbi:40S ribosomal protein S7 [Spraguea lophii 42_110]|uniref:40S ribosomal protein S7 n=1 Tax=Spraguea lophii (strain 42_110) TaxID=1358809 RepID=S7XV29_SPRLO|nr:Chain SH0, 40S ribosomal protein S7 [Spraguea lophii 42_110]7QJH_RH0 Chain RH0, 40S ribosomal protein S7 [Spraguea lophii 42_110]7QJH_SH0 Chain SH0, 40S ribosomal protein S7 [Spraguea lophii 42_110]8BR3_SH0 Chain SH0, 40S ribosomal protein S7 [Spraguea lophii 42_110]8P5D_SH0 Chain SH0, 40S ribosomal protein S7 [Spraguea lophii 42_110]8P60_RH0 Chain RH0, 40S ribosomal protein S7 [Spraguea lophii 42_110]8P60_SH0 Chain SH0, 40S ribosomal protein S7 [Spraguea lophii 42_110]EPR79708.1 40S ribo